MTEERLLLMDIKEMERIANTRYTPGELSWEHRNKISKSLARFHREKRKQKKNTPV